MPFRFFRRVPVAKGLTMNISKTGLSFSAGPRGGAATLGTSGARGTMSLPGTGLFYTVDKRNLWSGSKQKRAGGQASAADPDREVPMGSPLELGFFEKFLIPKEERIVVDGFKALVLGDHETALMAFEQAPNSADARWIAGMMRLKQREHARAEAHLNYALEHEDDLGRLVSKYQVEVILKLPITPELSAVARPRRRGTLLALTESYQDRGEMEKARACLETLFKELPEDPVVKLSLAELLMADEDPLADNTAKEIVAMVGEVKNESDVHAALMFYKAKALHVLGLNKAAVSTLTVAYRRGKGRDPELLRAIRYERALTYEALNQNARARAEFEGLYADAPDYEDVANRLGL